MSEEDRVRERPASTVDHFNPVDVTVSEAVGASFLGLLALLLLIALLRSQARNRKLLRQLAAQG